METPGQHQGLAEPFGRSLAADQSPAADQQDLHFLLIRGDLPFGRNEPSDSSQRRPRQHPPGHRVCIDHVASGCVMGRDLRACVARYRE